MPCVKVERGEPFDDFTKFFVSLVIAYFVELLLDGLGQFDMINMQCKTKECLVTFKSSECFCRFDLCKRLLQCCTKFLQPRRCRQNLLKHSQKICVVLQGFSKGLNILKD